MTRNRARPADYLLDMMRGAGETGRSAAYLVETGRLFGFSDNIVRVTLSRLQARGVIESPSRGQYRLAETADPLNEFVERWRLGEARVRPWDGSTWVIVHQPEASERGPWALDAIGFRPVDAGLFARPDNLSMTAEASRELLVSIGLPTTSLFVLGAPIGGQANDWPSRWDGNALNREYEDMTRRLEESASRLAGLDVDTARIETFRLGGEGIHLLAKDPLLPATFVDVGARERLWAAMNDYDAAGKAIWAASDRDNDIDEDNGLPIPRLASEG